MGKPDQLSEIFKTPLNPKEKQEVALSLELLRSLRVDPCYRAGFFHKALYLRIIYTNKRERTHWVPQIGADGFHLALPLAVSMLFTGAGSVSERWTTNKGGNSRGARWQVNGYSKVGEFLDKFFPNFATEKTYFDEFSSLRDQLEVMRELIETWGGGAVDNDKRTSIKARLDDLRASQTYPMPFSVGILAGMFDAGFGSATIQKPDSRAGRNGKPTSSDIRIKFTFATRLKAEEFSGLLQDAGLLEENDKVLISLDSARGGWHWGIRGLPADILLRELLPHLVLRREDVVGILNRSPVRQES